ncbi:MFS transporter [Actinokineospora spheciospongiae]|uniref:MFS transporter n=1 Tax=Actinokineospora spheciospongiae TaxID=909613 RepID=UPI000D9EF49B|nr:MFS transporter [Actinokineospora spheciospongiae]PWW53022.1 EmrB/QacA subfamily drug resistance transporter [Actinokineospora spheciospongiae]
MDSEPHPRRQWTLSVMSLSLLAIVLNNSVLNVAIPQLIEELDASTTEVQWIVDVYSLVFAGLLLAAGAVADRFGRKRFTLGGLVLFGLGSLLAAASDDVGQLLAARAVMGLGAAFVMPGTLSIIVQVFAPGPERQRAIAVWGGVSALGVAIGPVVGGVLVTHFGWASVFVLNVPLVLVTAGIGLVVVPEWRDPAAAPVDLPGAALGAAATVALVYAIIEAPVHGWVSPPVLGALAAAVAAGFGFTARMRRAEHPLVDLAVLRSRTFLGASVGNLLLVFGLAATLFVLTQRLQIAFGFSPLQAGLAIAPVAVAVGVSSGFAAALTTRLGTRGAVGLGLAVAAAGILTIAWAGGYWQVLAGLLAVGVGFGLSMSPATEAMLSTVPDERSGMGSAMNDTMQELGFALGVAVVGTVSQRLYADALADLPAAARSSLGGALRLSREEGRGGVADRALDAFTTAAGVGMTVAAAVVLAGAVFAAATLPARVRPGAAVGPERVGASSPPGAAGS